MTFFYSSFLVFKVARCSLYVRIPSLNCGLLEESEAGFYFFISIKYSLSRIWCNAMFWHRCSNNACVTLAYAWAKVSHGITPESLKGSLCLNSAWLGFFITLRFEKTVRMAFLRSWSKKKCPSVSVSVRVLQRNRTSRKIWNKELARGIMETEKCYNLWSVSWSLRKASGAGLVQAHGPKPGKLIIV